MIGLAMVEILSLVVAVVVYFLMVKLKYDKVWKKFLFMFLAIFLFMVMSEPMYRNPGLNSWAYIYRDIAWTIIIGWTSIFLISIVFVDRVWPKLTEYKKFFLYLATITVITVPIESILLKTGFRSYSIDLAGTFSGFSIPLTSIPIEVLIAVPMIGALVIPFYKFVSD